MPPQPLLKVRRNAKAIANPTVAFHRNPALAVHVAEVIASWARVESQLGTILALMLKGGVRASVAMYGAIRNAQAQLDALEAAAKVTLLPDDLRLFSAVMILVKRAGAKRHKMAHWLWGHSLQIDNALVLIDPDAELEFSTQSAELYTRIKEGDIHPPYPEFDFTNAYVYRKKDFSEIIRELWSIQTIVSRFAVLRNDLFANDIERRQLLASPQIQ
jgi:hypothetical protein